MWDKILVRGDLPKLWLMGISFAPLVYNRLSPFVRCHYRTQSTALVLIEIFSFEMTENYICFGSVNKQYALSSLKSPPKKRTHVSIPLMARTYPAWRNSEDVQHNFIQHSLT